MGLLPRPLHSAVALAVMPALLAAPGCAARSWRPLPVERLPRLEGRTVRAVCAAGDVELTVTRHDPPYLIGSCRAASNDAVPCTDRIRIDLRDCARVEEGRRRPLAVAGAVFVGAIATLGGLVGVALLAAAFDD